MAEKTKKVWCTLKQKMDALYQLNKRESLQKTAKDFMWRKFNNQKLEKKSKRHSVMFHDSRGRSFTGNLQNPQKAKASCFRRSTMNFVLPRQMKRNPNIRPHN